MKTQDDFDFEKFDAIRKAMLDRGELVQATLEWDGDKKNVVAVPAADGKFLFDSQYFQKS